MFKKNVTYDFQIHDVQKSPKGFNISHNLTDDQEKALCEMLKMRDFFILNGRAGCGKAEPLTTIIPSPNGDVAFGDLKIGDYIFDRFGNPTKVIGIYPQGNLDNYKVIFSDGRYVFCNDEHLWNTYTSKGNFKTRTLREMIDGGIKTKAKTRKNSYNYKYSIPINGAVNYSYKDDLPVDPYVLGAFIGDGCCRQRYLTISSETDFIPSKIAKILNLDYKRQSLSSYNWIFHNKDGRVVNTCDVFQDSLSLCGKYSYEKTISVEYLESSIKDRMSLLTGLLDTDGTIDKKGRVAFSTTSFLLKQSVQKLIRSLGMKSTFSKDNRGYKYTSGECFNIKILTTSENKRKMFSLPKHIANLNKYCESKKEFRNNNRVSIVSAECVGNVEMMCIMVDNDEHLYLTSDFTVTHNSYLLNHFIGLCKTKNVVLTATTHKALGVINGDYTIHSYLGLKLQQNRDKLKLVKNKFSEKISYGDIVCIDESSMLHKDLVDYIISAQKNYNLKIIFIADKAQLPPINEDISPIWKLNVPSYELTKIVRQAEGSNIISLSNEIRNGNISNLVFNKYVNDIDVFSGNFKEMKDFFCNNVVDNEHPTIISYRNSVVDNANIWARNIVQNKPKENLVEGENVYIRSTSEKQLHNLEDIVRIVKISNPYKYSKIKLKYEINVVKITVSSHKGDEELIIPFSKQDHVALKKNKKDIANEARSKKTLWGIFWKLSDSLSEVKVLYSMTAHRSQGSTFENVIVNVNDIGNNRKLLYTSLTRASKKLFLLRKQTNS